MLDPPVPLVRFDVLLPTRPCDKSVVVPHAVSYPPPGIILLDTDGATEHIGNAGWAVQNPTASSPLA